MPLASNADGVSQYVKKPDEPVGACVNDEAEVTNVVVANAVPTDV